MKYKVLRKQNISGMCIVCGTMNKLGMYTKFYECEREDGEQVLLAVFIPRDEHQSYPGMTHGGMTAAILDETIGRAACIPSPGIWGVTIDLSVKYRKPVPLGEKLYCEAKITKLSSRGFEGEGKILSGDGTVLATGFGKYMTLTPEKISPGGLTEENWFYEDIEFPTEIIIN
ncbi:MAG: PaaI family thioesterase [Firmicutes bacterium]|nr:PaaI family thioesterase [Bacillota bacterium]